MVIYLNESDPRLVEEEAISGQNPNLTPFSFEYALLNHAHMIDKLTFVSVAGPAVNAPNLVLVL